MKKTKIRNEMLRVHSELKTAIDFLHAASKPRHGSVVHEVLTKRLPVIRRRTGKVLNLLERRSFQCTTPNPNPQVPPVSLPVSGLLDPVSNRKPHWVRLRSEIKSGAHSYGSIARAIGKGTQARAAVHLVVNGKTKSGPVYDLVSRWAIANGYVQNPLSLSISKKGKRP